nr:MAG TPA: hypothetical protein [Caudoviricetes sp.]
MEFNSLCNLHIESVIVAGSISLWFNARISI